MVDVSIILVTYNSEWEKIKLTLLSILKQKNILKQIIIADDGSQKTYVDEIEELMSFYKFKDYLILNSPINHGTVLNIANAMKYVKGVYTKTIAPGDYLFNNTTLYNWVDFMSKNNVSVSFGDAVYYSKTNELLLYKTKGAPVNKKLFALGKYNSKQFVDYLLANDTILGAAQLMKSDILIKYLKIIENKVIYAEDYMIRIMIYDGINVVYYPNIVIWYEYGTGISTSKNSKWDKLLYADFEMSNDLISQRKADNFMQIKYQKYLKLRKVKNIKKIIKIICFPSVIVYRMRFKYVKESIPVGVNKKLFDWIDK